MPEYMRDGRGEYYPYQVAGHQQIYRHPEHPDWLLKPSCPRELAFYEATRQLPLLVPLLPPYHGHLEGGDTLILGDLTHSLQQPAVMDIKLGHRIYDVDATPEKRQRKQLKALRYTNAALGFRICGVACSRLQLSKEEAKRLPIAKVLPTLRTFLPRWLLRDLRARCWEMRTVVAQSPVLMYCTSLLICYDEGSSNRWECRLIDFSHSHVLERVQPDENFLGGLDSFIGHLDTLIHRD